MNTIVFSCELLTWLRFHDLLNCCWLLYYNSGYPWIGSVYFREIKVPRDIICWLEDILHVVMLTVLVNDTNSSTSWCKSYNNFKYIIFCEGMIWDIYFNVGRVENMCQSWFQKQVNILFQMFIKFSRWTIFDFLSIPVTPFHCSSSFGIIHELSFFVPVI